MKKAIFFIPAVLIFLALYRQFPLYQSAHSFPWKKALRLVRSQSSGKPNIFVDPLWLRGYMCDMGRCLGTKVLTERPDDSPQRFWLITPKEGRHGFRDRSVIRRARFGQLRIMLLVKRRVAGP